MRISILNLLFTLALFAELVSAKDKVTVKKDDTVTYDCKGNDECCTDSAQWIEIVNRGSVKDQTLKKGRFCSQDGKFKECRESADCTANCNSGCLIKVELDVPKNRNRSSNTIRILQGQCLEETKKKCLCTTNDERNRRCARRVVNDRCQLLNTNQRRTVIDRFERVCKNLFK